MSQFSFQIPRPLQENYVRKRPARITASDGTDLGMPGLIEPSAGMYKPGALIMGWGYTFYFDQQSKNLIKK